MGNNGVTPLEEIKDIWEDYRSSLVRADKLRDRLKTKIRDALETDISQSDIARTLGIPRQQVHRYLGGISDIDERAAAALGHPEHTASSGGAP